MTDVVSQLVNIYLNHETWHKEKLSREESIKYFQKLVERGRILWYTYKGEVVAYLETWRINYEQFGRIICKEPFSSYKEDVETGNIAYVANCWCHPSYRQTNIYRLIRNKFFEQNKDCEYFVGEARRKRCGLIKVFKRSEIFLKGGTDGKREENGSSRNTSAATDYATANR